MRRLAISLILALGATLSPARTSHADLPEIAVIANPSTRFDALGPAELEAIFTTGKRFTEDGTPIQPANLPPRNATRVAFDIAVLQMDPDEVERFWIDRKIRGGAPPPRQVSDEDLMARFVAKVPGAIGYLSASSRPNEVRVVAVIRGGKLIPR